MGQPRLSVGGGPPGGMLGGTGPEAGWLTYAEALCSGEDRPAFLSSWLQAWRQSGPEVGVKEAAILPSRLHTYSPQFIYALENFRKV